MYAFLNKKPLRYSLSLNGATQFSSDSLAEHWWQCTTINSGAKDPYKMVYAPVQYVVSCGINLFIKFIITLPATQAETRMEESSCTGEEKKILFYQHCFFVSLALYVYVFVWVQWGDSISDSPSLSLQCSEVYGRPCRSVACKGKEREGWRIEWHKRMKCG